ncbi:MAG: hypothetical protein B7Z80_19235 [Rhodospirillales bacterium 20-64-7]|nr:MAG: hypothetical protein B7Z80_19235 [Rhodospirillales bacterium 20-64-7]HQT76581.1 hypothetical protein [Rhodopila sp.]
MTRFSNEPEADADDLDDDELLEAYLGIDAGSGIKDPAIAAQPSSIPDWPSRLTRDLRLDLNVDADTVEWFKAHHTDWRAEMRFVLRAWVRAEDNGTAKPTAA